MLIKKNDKIYIAGHNGLVGSSILRKLREKGYTKLIYKSKKELDLINQKKVYHFLRIQKPKFIFIAAAKVGGILTNNSLRGQFIFENLAIQNNIIDGAYRAGVKNLIFLGSNCVYPKNCPQPIKEKYLLNNFLEYTNEPYAIAKIAGIKLCENYNMQYGLNYKCLMPSNLYGPNDNYNPKTSHFLPGIISKAIDYKENKKKFILWGNGLAKREVLYVDDLANACVYFMNKKTKHNVINIGSGIDYPIKYYANYVLKILKVKCQIYFDKSKPNGTPRKLLDCSIAKSYGWRPEISLKEGIIFTLKDLKKYK
jgi:GDP-L-fucose synthase